MGDLNILIVAGEASGDAHGGALMRELSARAPGTRFFGMGGPAMKAAGLDALYDSSEISVMGIAEVLPKLLRILGVLSGIARAAEQRRPDLAVLIDVPDFNLRLAKKLKRRGIPVVYYVSPTVWAWRRGRVKQIARDVDTMLCILPFEPEFYAQHGVLARYVGNPVVDHIPRAEPPQAFRARLGLESAKKTVALLPGSRKSELARVLPTMIDAAERLAETFADLQLVLPVAPNLAREHVLAYFEGRKVRPVLVDGRAAECVGASDASIVCSGTATLEAALMLRPFVVVYRVSWLTEWTFRFFVKVAHVSLANILAGRRLVPELLQHEFTAERVANAVGGYLEGDAESQAMVEGLKAVRASLGETGASGRAAEAVLEVARKAVSRQPATVSVTRAS